MAYASNPFDHMLPHDRPYPTVAMPQPFNRVPVFSTMGRGPRGEKGERGFPGEASRKDFETVADMVAEGSLEAGDICRTLGFHEAGDGGAAWYQVTNDATANGMDIIALENGLYAELRITEAYVTPEMFGAYGDGEIDDADFLQAMFDQDNCNKCLINGKIYKTSKTIFITKEFTLINGNDATIYYSGDSNAIYIDMSSYPSHHRDLSKFCNLVIKAPYSDVALFNNYAIKTIFENIRIYNFGHIGIKMTNGGYESYYTNIWLFAQKKSGTIGITGGFGDVEFGNLFGCNVETFIKGIAWGSNNIQKVHAWCSKNVTIDDEPIMSDSDWNTWYANTSLLEFDTNTGASAWNVVFEYVNCDTYNTCIKWDSYFHSLTFNHLCCYGNVNNLISTPSNSTKAYASEIIIHDLECSQAILDAILAANMRNIPNIKMINGKEYQPALAVTYIDYNDTERTIYIPFGSSIVRFYKPKTSVSILAHCIGIIPFIQQHNAQNVTVKQPWNGTNGSAVIYASDFGDDNMAYLMFYQQAPAGNNDVKLIKTTQFTSH